MFLYLWRFLFSLFYFSFHLLFILCNVVRYYNCCILNNRVTAASLSDSRRPPSVPFSRTGRSVIRPSLEQARTMISNLRRDLFRFVETWIGVRTCFTLGTCFYIQLLSLCIGKTTFLFNSKINSVYWRIQAGRIFGIKKDLSKLEKRIKWKNCNLCPFNGRIIKKILEFLFPLLSFFWS